jgi:hypothetical protein
MFRRGLCVFRDRGLWKKLKNRFNEQEQQYDKTYNINRDKSIKWTKKILNPELIDDKVLLKLIIGSTIFLFVVKYFLFFPQMNMTIDDLENEVQIAYKKEEKHGVFKLKKMGQQSPESS